MRISTMRLVTRIIIFLLMISGGTATLASDAATTSADLETDYDVSLDPTLGYEKPTFTGWFTRAPSNLKAFGKELIDPENMEELGWIAASTAVLIHYDQDILDASQKLGRELGLISDKKTGREIGYVFNHKVNGIDLPIYYPKNTISSFYYLGDGYPQLALGIGMTSYGLWTNNYRVLSVVSQNVESLFVTGIVVQIMKRSFGRESPFVRDTDGGNWDFFPNQNNYNYDTPNYDAFPSGHIATLMATTTVFAENYPEYRYIRPVGYTLMGLLAFGMLNNGVHWAGDYPVGIAIGYTSAKIVTSAHKKKRRAKTLGMNPNKPQLRFAPAVIDDSPAIAAHYIF